jgi:hypothetical protein
MMRTRLSTALALAAAAVALSAPAAAQADPLVKDSWATAVLSTAADLHAVVNPEGANANARFEYITTAAYQANLAASKDGFAGSLKSPPGNDTPIGSGSSDLQFDRHVVGLKASTSYRYRVVVIGSATVFGSVGAIFTQEATASFALPDGRGWEMVSPVDKNGGEIQAAGGNFDGGVLQAAADGGSITYSSASSFISPLGSPGASQYISRRGGTGWGTENVTAPTLAGAYGASPDGVPYQLFSGDLARGLISIPQRCASAPCLRGYSLRTSPGGALAPSAEETDLSFAGANPGFSQVVLSTCAALTADAVEVPGVGGCDPSQANLYRWSGGAPTLINLLPGAPVGTPGAGLAAQANAISTDGSRIYFSLAGNLYLRQGGQTLWVDEAQGGGGSFETASADGSVAFFSKGGDIFRYLAATDTATDLTPGAGVQGVLGASPDGSYLYYLTAAGLFLYRGGTSSKVAATADAGNYPPATGTTRIAANGNLAFLSAATLTEVDAGGLTQVYIYAPATGTLTCASCNPTGARPLGAASIPGAVANGKGAGATQAYKPRALAAAGTRLFFDSRDALVTTDTNSDQDVYQWEAQGTGGCVKAGGCVDLISSGRAKAGASFVDASADGADAFFLTAESLVSTDPGVADVYDARVGGGFGVGQVPIACVSDACQVVPGEPEDPGTGTSFYRTEGNPPLSLPKTKKKKKGHHKKKHGKAQHKGSKPKAHDKREGR